MYARHPFFLGNTLPLVPSLDLQYQTPYWQWNVCFSPRLKLKGVFSNHTGWLLACATGVLIFGRPMPTASSKCAHSTPLVKLKYLLQFTLISTTIIVNPSYRKTFCPTYDEPWSISSKLAGLDTQAYVMSTLTSKITWATSANNTHSNNQTSTYAWRHWKMVYYKDTRGGSTATILSMFHRCSSGNTINCIHDHLEASNWGSKWRLDWFSCRTSPKLGLDLNSGHICSHEDPSAKCPFEAIRVVYKYH